MVDAADFIARHAIALLLATTVVLLAATALLWSLVLVYAPRLWRFSVAAWNALRSTAPAQRLRRTPLIGPVLNSALTTASYLGVYAAVAFVIAAGAIAAFFEIADEIGVGEGLAEFDAALSSALHQHLSRPTLEWFAALTTLGDRDVLIALSALIALGLAIAQRWFLAVAWLAATASGGLLNTLLKTLFARDRPFHDHGLVHTSSFSFPSGHASGSMLVFGLLGYLLVRHTRAPWHIPIALATAALIVFVGFSRVLLQVHYFSDVIAGYVSAAAWVCLCIAGMEAVRWRNRTADAPRATI